MPHKIKPAPELFTGLRPRTPAERHSLLKIALAVVLAMLAVAGLWFSKRHSQIERQDKWSNAIGTIENVRPVLAAKSDGNFGGAMLYTIQVLVRYPSNVGSKERWITVSQRPETLAEAQAQSVRWKGATCVVRWNPTSPEQIEAEVS